MPMNRVSDQHGTRTLRVCGGMHTLAVTSSPLTVPTAHSAAGKPCLVLESSQLQRSSEFMDLGGELTNPLY